jgi:hypothetical protein
VDAIDSVPLTGPLPTFANPNEPEPMTFNPAQTLVTA